MYADSSKQSALSSEANEVEDGFDMVPTDLDALLSPPPVENIQFSTRDSVAESELNEIPLDDDTRFSTVPLSGRQSTSSNFSRVSRSSRLDDSRRNTVSMGRPGSSTSVAAKIFHKKSSSSTTARDSAANLPFLLQRLDIQKAQDDSNPSAHRSSLEVQQRLQEELSRLQNGHQQESSDSVLNGQVDWGVCVRWWLRYN